VPSKKGEKDYEKPKNWPVRGNCQEVSNARGTLSRGALSFILIKKKVTA